MTASELGQTLFLVTGELRLQQAVTFYVFACKLLAIEEATT